MFSAMLTDAFGDGNVGINISYHTDGQLFNLRCLSAKTRVQSVTIRDFLFADDYALNASTEDMQRVLTDFHQLAQTLD